MSEAAPPGQGGGLPDPARHLLFVESAFVDVAPARVLVLAGAGRDGTQQPALKEGHLHVAGKDVVTEEPPPAAGRAALRPQPPVP